MAFLLEWLGVNEDDEPRPILPLTQEDGIYVNMQDIEEKEDREEETEVEIRERFVARIWEEMIQFYGREPRYETDLLYGIAKTNDVWWVPSQHLIGITLFKHHQTYGELGAIRTYTSPYGSFAIYSESVVQTCIEDLADMCRTHGKVLEQIGEQDIDMTKESENENKV